MEPSLGEVAKAQALIESGPLSFVAGVFALAFMGMLWLYVRAKDQQRESEQSHASRLAEVHSSFTDRVVRLEVVLDDFLELAADIKELALDARRRREKSERRETSGRFAVVPPPDEKDKP